ncbi:hypothetical protein PO909_023724 [Leuciscus waleckii]
MVFDARLTWAGHIEKVIVKCKKVLNVMRCLAGVDWGASRKALKGIYDALIKSVIDYGCIAYRDAAKTTLAKLDVQAQALRICSGAFHTSPAVAIQVEMDEMPLTLRREQLTANYWANLQGQDRSHPTRAVIQVCWEHERVKSQSFGWVGDAIGKEMGLEGKEFSPTVQLPAAPPWDYKEMYIDLGLLEEKQGIGMDKYRVQRYLMEMYREDLIIYTDASKPIDKRMGVAYVIPKLKVKIGQRISDDLAVYTAELVAVWLALLWVEVNRPGKAVIASDSSSALISIKTCQSKSRQDIVIEIIQVANNLLQSGTEITLIWVPAHIVVVGNEFADRCAKQAAGNSNVDIEVNYSKAEIKSMVKNIVKGKWQTLWDSGQTGGQFFYIQNKVGKGRNMNRSKEEEDVLSRMRYGHTRLNKTLVIMKQHADCNCEFCDSPESVEHVILQCPKYQEERQSLSSQLQRKQLRLNLEDILQRSSGEICFKYIFSVLRNTGLIKTI